jgi:hypothetical protein
MAVNSHILSSNLPDISGQLIKPLITNTALRLRF